ncbi:HNH endonuclease [Caulobacter segnis]|nr:HNH endonuclease [Caulobacter segnis]
MEACVDDWIVFRQPRAAGGNLAYFATAKIAAIVPDPMLDKHYYAIIERYSPFEKPVPWLREGRYSERALRDLENVSQLGLYLRGKSVRPLEDGDFLSIVEAGFSNLWDSPGEGDLDRAELDLLASRLAASSAAQRERAIISLLVNKKLRDRNFRRAVGAAYHWRCAISGLSLKDRGGNYEVQGAHIVSVAEGGPDIVPNGIALSGTLHWLFDRHLISIGEDHGILIGTQGLPTGLLALIRSSGDRLSLPANQQHWPAEQFLSRHRSRFREIHRIG